MLRRTFSLVLLGFSLVSLIPAAARAGLTAQSDETQRVASGADFVEAHQYRLPNLRVAGADSTRQSVTAWEVSKGSWNGEKLSGLSLVLVKSISEDGNAPSTTNCYISHLATPAQRDALVSAYLASQSMAPGELRKWRLEPAVIRLEIAGKTVIVHLGLVA
jgi:hypothetical protein